MKTRTLLMTGATVFLGTMSTLTWAHRVNVFAWVDGQQVHTESKFSNGVKVRFGEITVVDPVTKKVLVTGKTDDKGTYTFTVPKVAETDGHGLLVEINAGEGHQNSWTVQPDELSAEVIPADTAATTPNATDGAALTPKEATVSAGTDVAAAGAVVVGSGLTAHQVEVIVNQALDHKLAPLNRRLVEATDKSVKLSDIIGGIGWIFGLFGVAALVRYRREKPVKKENV